MDSYFCSGVILMFLLLFKDVNAQLEEDFDPDVPCQDYKADSDPTLCTQIQVYEDKIKEYSILNAIGILKLKNRLFPLMSKFWEAFIVYDEPIYPVLIGPSVWLLFGVAVLFCYYLTKLCHNCLASTKDKMQLRPDHAKIPMLPLYWLQQSKREMSLRREVRNTWAWLAKKYVFSADDPLMDGIDESLNKTTWDDFQIPRDTASLVNAIMALNDLYIEIQEKHGKKKLKVVKKLPEEAPTPSLIPSQKPKSKAKEAKAETKINIPPEELTAIEKADEPEPLKPKESFASIGKLARKSMQAVTTWKTKKSTKSESVSAPAISIPPEPKPVKVKPKKTEETQTDETKPTPKVSKQGVASVQKSTFPLEATAPLEISAPEKQKKVRKKRRPIKKKPINPAPVPAPEKEKSPKTKKKRSKSAPAGTSQPKETQNVAVKAQKRKSKKTFIPAKSPPPPPKTTKKPTPQPTSSGPVANDTKKHPPADNKLSTGFGDSLQKCETTPPEPPHKSPPHKKRRSKHKKKKSRPHPHEPNIHPPPPEPKIRVHQTCDGEINFEMVDPVRNKDCVLLVHRDHDEITIEVNETPQQPDQCQRRDNEDPPNNSWC